MTKKQVAANVQKIQVLADNVISRGKGMVRFYDNSGQIVALSAKEVAIVETIDEVTGGEDAAQLAVEDSRRDFEAEEDAEVAVEQYVDENGNPCDADGNPLAAEPEGELEEADLEGPQDLEDQLETALAEADEEDSHVEAEIKPNPAPRRAIKPTGAKASKGDKMTTAASGTSVKVKKTAPPKKVLAKTAKTAAPAKAKPTAAPAAASGTRTIAGREHDISGYTKVVSASGGTSYDNGDNVAEQLRGLSIDEVYAKAAKVLGEVEKELRASYKHLNSGMQRMTLGNRMRKVLREKEAKKASKAA